jgi:hypothetical protein
MSPPTPQKQTKGDACAQHTFLQEWGARRAGLPFSGTVLAIE